MDRQRPRTVAEGPGGPRSTAALACLKARHAFLSAFGVCSLGLKFAVNNILRFPLSVTVTSQFDVPVDPFGNEDQLCFS